MLRWLKKYFIPHEHNDYKPHILRSGSVIFILGIVVLAELLFLVQVFVLFPNVKFFADILTSILIQDTNNNRLADNLPALKINSQLMQAAQAKANDMAANGYFSHTGPSGITPWYWIKQAGYSYSYAGENLAINFSDSHDAVNAWMNSPSHKANILNNYFTDIGIGIAKGTYQGEDTVFIVQMFGRPVSVAVVSNQSNPVAIKPSAAATKSIAPATTPAVSINSEDSPVKAENTRNSQLETGQPAAQTNVLQNLIASPASRTKYIYFAILAIILLALILNVFIKIKFQHPHLVVNAVILIIIINSVLLLNQYIVNINSKVF